MALTAVTYRRKPLVLIVIGISTGGKEWVLAHRPERAALRPPRSHEGSSHDRIDEVSPREQPVEVEEALTRRRGDEAMLVGIGFEGFVDAFGEALVERLDGVGILRRRGAETC